VQQGSSDPAEEGAPQQVEFTGSARRSRRGPAVVILATIAFLGVALLTKQATSVVNVPVASIAAAASPAAAASLSPIPSATLTAPDPVGPPARDPTARPYPTFVAVAAPAGAIRLVPAGSAPVSLDVTLPDGWAQASTAMYVAPTGTASVGLSISAWTIRHVNLFPCRWTTPEFSDELFDRTAEGQAQALSAWWGQDPNAPFSSNATIAPIATEPRATRIDGYPAWYVEVLVPSVFDFSQCDGGQLVLWQTADGDVRYALGPGELDRLWVVDIDDTPIVIDASLPVMASSAEEAALQRVVDSIAVKP
jgi:hypothetical protein